MNYSYGTNADQYLNKEGLEYLISQLDLKYSGGGSTGNDGVGIQSVELVNYELIVTLTDTTVINLGNVRGEKGIQGIQGLTGAKGIDGINGTNGKDGLDGVNGTNGRGITSIVKTDTVGLIDTYTITYSDMTTSNFTVTNGADGEGGSGGGSSTDTYSTDETAIGTWIDGKTIYRKVIEFGVLPSITSGNFAQKSIAIGTEITKFIDIKALLQYGTTSMIASPSFSNVQMNPNGTHSKYIAEIEKAKITLFGAGQKVMFYYGADWANYNCTIVAEYIK
jgi:hypothetical protein